MTKGRYMSLLQMKKDVKKRPDPTCERFRQKDSHHLSLEMCQRLAIEGSVQLEVDPSATMMPGHRPIYRGLLPSTNKLKRKANQTFDQAKRKKISNL